MLCSSLCIFVSWSKLTYFYNYYMYRAAAKVVSYVDAGASSSDDNHQHNKKEKTTGKSTDTVGDSSDSGGESEEDWNDSSSASEEDESSSSSDSPSEDSDASDVEMSAGADEAAKKNSSNRKSKGAGGVSNVTKAKKPRKIGTASGARVYWDNNMVCSFQHITSFSSNLIVFSLN